jgi:hypothetical protein
MPRPGWERNYGDLERQRCEVRGAEGKVEWREVVLYAP